MFKKSVKQRVQDTKQLVLAQEMLLVVDNYISLNMFKKWVKQKVQATMVQLVLALEM